MTAATAPLFIAFCTLVENGMLPRSIRAIFPATVLGMSAGKPRPQATSSPVTPLVCPANAKPSAENEPTLLVTPASNPVPGGTVDKIKTPGATTSSVGPLLLKLASLLATSTAPTAMLTG